MKFISFRLLMVRRSPEIIACLLNSVVANWICFCRGSIHLEFIARWCPHFPKLLQLLSDIWNLAYSHTSSPTPHTAVSASSSYDCWLHVIIQIFSFVCLKIKGHPLHHSTTLNVALIRSIDPLMITFNWYSVLQVLPPLETTCFW